MIFTAAEARGEAIAWQENNYKEQLEVIENAIQSAVLQGQFQTEISGSILTALKARLKELGYFVEIRSQYNETWTVIKW